MTARPSPRPLTSAARSLSTVAGESAPGSFYGGMIGGSFVDPKEHTYKNEVGRPSHGREDALIGVSAALEFVKNPDSVQPARDVFHEFSMQDHVGMSLWSQEVSDPSDFLSVFYTEDDSPSANGGIGLEMALALAEAGATVYCLDLADQGSSEFQAAAKYAIKLGSRMVYIKGDVTDQPLMDKIALDIAEKEGRIDCCIAAAGILMSAPCLDYPIDDFQKVLTVNVNGVFITATAVAKQMARLDRPGKSKLNGFFLSKANLVIITGSIILIGSMSGSITNREEPWAAYNASKAAVIQMARSLACELGPRGIRVNSLSPGESPFNRRINPNTDFSSLPGHIKTALTNQFLEKEPQYEQKWSNLNPLGRLGKIHEMRGPAVWLASDASSYCTGSDIIIAGGHTAW
ncbi:hypothetical protein P7C70_g4806, partial [Phenoliferia sp. Uapishka_3]